MVGLNMALQCDSLIRAALCSKKHWLRLKCHTAFVVQRTEALFHAFGVKRPQGELAAGKVAGSLASCRPVGGTVMRIKAGGVTRQGDGGRYFASSASNVPASTVWINEIAAALGTAAILITTATV